MLTSSFLGTFSLCAAGCVSQAMQVADLDQQAAAAVAPQQVVAVVAEEESQFRIATLGAGDSLGRAIFVNDIVLAAAQGQRRHDARQPDQAIVSAPID